MLAKLNDLKHLAPEDFDAEVGKALKTMRAARLAEYPPAKPKKKAAPKPKKKPAAKK